MAMMLGALYQALVEAHASEEHARRAAEEVAAYEARVVAIERDLTVLKWMVGTNIALSLLILGRILVH